MKLKNNRFLSFAMMVAMCLSSFTFAFAAYDEGVYTPEQIAKLPLLKRGLKIKASDVYNPKGGGLTDAIIRLNANGGGCTAEFVAPDGLILTNHHCGFSALVDASTPDKDLVETGFDAGSRAGEISAKGFSIMLTQRIEDVTAKIKAGTDTLNSETLAAAIKKNTDDLTAAEQAKAPKGSTIRIQAIDSGFFYYLYQTSEIKDIRVVYAPPRNIGVFGGDPDNFEWTRHTGDFTFLRAYTAPDGSPAEYSPNNVPYKAKKYLTMNIGGLKDNDFVFVLGFPGGTTRYRESWSIEYARDANFPFQAAWYRELANALKRIGSTDENKRIEFQDNVAIFDNERKLFEGGARRLRLANVVQQRQAEEVKLSAWIAASPSRLAKYGTVIPELRSLSLETNAASKRDAITRRFPDPNSMPVLVQAVAAATSVKNGRKLTKEQKQAKLAEVKGAFAQREPLLESELLKFFFKSFDGLPADQRFVAADQKFSGKTGQNRRAAEAAFASDIANGDLSKPDSILDLYDDSWSTIQKRHPFIAGLVDERAALAARATKFGANIDRLRTLYMQALTMMQAKTPIYPDANFTMRFSYGNVKGYQSREAEYRSPFTTMKGMIEKDTGENPFDAPKKLIDMQKSRDFGRYGEKDSVVLNFLSTTDIIGGNSGSPILNGNGEQVGICFDGNYEGLGNDFYYDPAVNRTISVDIRYVLFITEKFGGAKWVVDEMKLVGKK
ncbi:MAG: S46 family peptidase [Pyrinomonadaceae bacterium]